MANPEHLQILQQGVTAWNEWRDQNRDITPDFSEADLREVSLSQADLRGADRRGANLRGANLRGADLLRANLRGADLSEVRLHETAFGNTNLTVERGLEPV